MYIDCIYIVYRCRGFFLDLLSIFPPHLMSKPRVAGSAGTDRCRSRTFPTELFCVSANGNSTVNSAVVSAREMFAISR